MTVTIDAKQAILDRGLRIPNDVTLAGFDGLRNSLVTSPSITTVSQPLAEIGRESVLALLRLIDDNSTLPLQKTLPVELVIRSAAGTRLYRDDMGARGVQLCIGL